MAEAPENVTLDSAFVPAAGEAVWPLLADVGAWARLFPGWTAKVETDDDRFTATGPRGERFDLYPAADDERFALDVEVVDELGSADTLRLRVIAATGGCFVVAAHGRLMGTPDSQWAAKRESIASGIDGIGDLL